MGAGWGNTDDADLTDLRGLAFAALRRLEGLEV